jgi:hypothetical protein
MPDLFSRLRAQALDLRFAAMLQAAASTGASALAAQRCAT